MSSKNIVRKTWREVNSVRFDIPLPACLKWKSLLAHQVSCSFLWSFLTLWMALPPWTGMPETRDSSLSWAPYPISHRASGLHLLSLASFYYRVQASRISLTWTVSCHSLLSGPLLPIFSISSSFSKIIFFFPFFFSSLLAFLKIEKNPREENNHHPYCNHLELIAVDILFICCQFFFWKKNHSFVFQK